MRVAGGLDSASQAELIKGKKKGGTAAAPSEENIGSILFDSTSSFEDKQAERAASFKSTSGGIKKEMEAAAKQAAQEKRAERVGEFRTIDRSPPQQKMDDQTDSLPDLSGKPRNLAEEWGPSQATPGCDIPGTASPQVIPDTGPTQELSRPCGDCNSPFCHICEWTICTNGKCENCKKYWKFMRESMNRNGPSSGACEGRGRPSTRFPRRKLADGKIFVKTICVLGKKCHFQKKQK